MAEAYNQGYGNGVTTPQQFQRMLQLDQQQQMMQQEQLFSPSNLNRVQGRGNSQLGKPNGLTDIQIDYNELMKSQASNNSYLQGTSKTRPGDSMTTAPQRILAPPPAIMPSQRRQELINEVNSKQRSANDLPPVQLLNQNRTRQQDINNALANAQSYQGSYESGPNQGEGYQGEENEIQRHYDDIMHKMEQQKLQQQQFNGQQYQRPAGKIAQQVQRNNSKDNNSIQSPSGREANKSSLIGYGQQTILSPHGSSNSPILLQGTNLKGSMPSKRALDEQKFLMHYQKPMADKTVEQGSYLIGMDPVISQRFSKNMSVMKPAGGTAQMDLQLIHLPASMGVERLLAHPPDKNDPKAFDKMKEHARYSALMHGIKSMRPHSIRVNQPNNFGATFMNVIGNPGLAPSHRDWIIENQTSYFANY